MNHCVPDVEIQMDDEDYHLPMPSAFPRQKKPSTADDEIMELLWQNGQVVMQNQNHRPPRKHPTPARNSGDEIPAGPSTAREVRPEVETCNQHLFMQEDEMISWLHYPIDVVDPPLDQSFCADFLYAPTTFNANQSGSSNDNGNSAMQTPARTSQMTELRQPPSRTVAPRRLPIPLARRPEKEPANSPNFAKHNTRGEAPGPSSSSKKATVAREPTTVVESCDTPVAATSRVSETVRFTAEHTEGDACRRSISGAGAAAPSKACGLTMTSSPGGSRNSGEPVQRATAEDRKRKGWAEEEWECQSEDVAFESAEAKKQSRGSTSTRRSRAAEVHNLSERRRRDRINEKMRALQELIPHCNRSDKASMLDEAIEYLKSLQLQVQMMSIGCGMVPMMFPGIQQYMPAMGMGIGMGMGMEMGMNRPVMPFPNMLAGSALTASAAAHLGPRLPMPPFPMPHVPAPNASRMQAANQSDNNMLSSIATPDPNQSRMPNFADPYQQYLGPHQMQFQLMQNLAVNQPNVSKPSTNSGLGYPENHQPG